MIKLLVVSWVQVFITFMPAYFRGCLFRNLYYVSIAFIWHGSHRTQSAPGRSVFCATVRGCTQSREWEKSKSGGGSGDLPWMRMTQIITPPFLLSRLVPFTWTLSKEKKRKKNPSLLSSAKNARMSVKERALMKFWCEALRCMVNSDGGKLTFICAQ